MVAGKIASALALLLAVTSLAMAQGQTQHRPSHHRPGVYFGNDYGPRFRNLRSRPDAGIHRRQQ
jgi:hypothetical protein